MYDSAAWYGTPASGIRLPSASVPREVKTMSSSRATVSASAPNVS